MRKIRILYIETGTSGGGSFESLYQTLKAIDKRKFLPIVIFLNPNRFCHKLEELKVRYYIISDPVYSKIFGKILTNVLSKLSQIIGSYCPTFSITYEYITHWFTIRFISSIAASHSIEIIHINDQINRDFFALFVAKKQGIKCISHLRSPDTFGFNRKKADYANKVVSYYIAYSEWIRDIWAQKGISQDKVKVIYNAIDTSELIEKKDLHKKYCIPEDHSIIGCVGYLIPNRGYDFMIEAFSRILRDRPKCKLLIVGGGKTKIVDQLNKLVHFLGIQDRVIFTGATKDAKEIIAGFDVFVLPYRTEALGRTLLEAWLAKTPVIATNTGGIDKVIKHSYNGMLVSYGDLDTLESTIISVLVDNELKEKLIKEGYTTVKEKFDISSYIAKLENLYMMT